MKKAVLTVIGNDRVGIIARVSNCLADANINILDISQTTMSDMFTMIMLVDVSKSNVDFHVMAQRIKELGDEMQMQMQLQDTDIFNSMHKI
ncbi:MAG: ACT domain-containing protein [Ruminococcaceae bacterium]|nr:ACT domain-containing protein [Oscillospiraceae bacterium]